MGPPKTSFSKRSSYASKMEFKEAEEGPTSARPTMLADLVRAVPLLKGVVDKKYSMVRCPTKELLKDFTRSPVTW